MKFSRSSEHSSRNLAEWISTKNLPLVMGNMDGDIWIMPICIISGTSRTKSRVWLLKLQQPQNFLRFVISGGRSTAPSGRQSEFTRLSTASGMLKEWQCQLQKIHVIFRVNLIWTGHRYSWAMLIYYAQVYLIRQGLSSIAAWIG